MPLNILVVDDSAVMRSIIKKTLALSGVAVGEVFEAGNGCDGLRVLEENWIDIALIDIHMPVMDGEEMIRHIRNSDENQRLPVIVVSSESDQNRIEMLQREGTSFVHKPFTPETLREVIIEVTGVINERTN